MALLVFVSPTLPATTELMDVFVKVSMTGAVWLRTLRTALRGHAGRVEVLLS